MCRDLRNGALASADERRRSCDSRPRAVERPGRHRLEPVLGRRGWADSSGGRSSCSRRSATTRCGSADGATRPGPAPLPLLAAVAARTERLKLGTSVLVAPPRNPVLLAKELATIDLISNGRLLPGVRHRPGASGRARGARRRAGGARRALRGMRDGRSGALVRRAGHVPRPVHDARAGDPDARGRRGPDSISGSAARLRRRSVASPGSPTAGLQPRSAPDAFAGLVDVLRAEARESGRQVPEDHFGTRAVRRRERGRGGAAPRCTRAGPAATPRRASPSASTGRAPCSTATGMRARRSSCSTRSRPIPGRCSSCSSARWSTASRPSPCTGAELRGRRAPRPPRRRPGRRACARRRGARPRPAARRRGRG